MLLAVFSAVAAASEAGLVTTPTLGMYCATKHAVVGMTESLYHELAPQGIGVSCLCPAGVATNIIEQMTFYGEPHPPRGPSFAILEADAVGELVADGVTADRFLILTAPEVPDELREHGADLDAYLAARTEPLA